MASSYTDMFWSVMATPAKAAATPATTAYSYMTAPSAPIGRKPGDIGFVWSGSSGYRYTRLTNGSIQIVAGPKAVGMIYAPGSAGWNAVMQEAGVLARGGIPSSTPSAPAPSYAPSASAALPPFPVLPPTPTDQLTEDTPIYQRSWFLPVVGVGIVGLAALIVLWPSGGGQR